MHDIEKLIRTTMFALLKYERTSGCSNIPLDQEKRNAIAFSLAMAVTRPDHKTELINPEWYAGTFRRWYHRNYGFIKLDDAIPGNLQDVLLSH